MHYDHEAEQHRLRRLFWRMGEFKFYNQRYLIEGFLPESGLVILAGDPKAGKTALASAIALAVAKGRPFAGMYTKQSGVLWLCLEESHQERAAVMRKARGISRLPIYVTNERIPIDTDQGIADLQHWALQAGAGLIVIDPLHAAHSGRSLHDGWSARKTLSLLKEFSKTRTILVLHHLAKSGARRVAESVQLSAIATMVMLLDSSPPGRGPVPTKSRTDVREITAPHTKRPRIVSLECMGRGEYANRTWQFLSKNPLDYQSTIAVPAIPGSLASRILEALGGVKPKSAKDIATELDMSVKSIRNEMTSLKQLGLIIAEKLRYANYYKLARLRK